MIESFGRIYGTIECFGRFSGTEDGWMMFQDDANVWEEPASDWEEVIDLVRGGTVFRHKRTKLEVNQAS